jgi:hypothetical protein
MRENRHTVNRINFATCFTGFAAELYMPLQEW